MRRFGSPVSGVVGLFFLLSAGDAPAAVSARVCNESATGMWVAYGYYVDDAVKWVTTGWWWADPDQCTDAVDLHPKPKEVYVYATSNDDDVEWKGTKPLCVSMDEAFEYDDAEARACETKRPFRKYTPKAGKLEVTLGDADSLRVAFDFTLCNRTEDLVSVVVGNAPGAGGGVSADGWHAIDPADCARFIRRGKQDYAYFYAQTVGRQLVWHGDVPLCTRYHQAFALDKADSIACKDGDSERLPFVRKPLVKGRGTHDLEAEKARAFPFGLNVCNGYTEDVYSVVAHLDGIWMNGYIARGYWRLRPGECRLVDAVAASPVFVYAETDAIDKVWDGKDLTGCVRDQAFTLTGVDRYACNGEGERKVGFRKWDVSDGANVYKFE